VRPLELLAIFGFELVHAPELLGPAPQESKNGA
jgi:hypothetical protein